MSSTNYSEAMAYLADGTKSFEELAAVDRISPEQRVQFSLQMAKVLAVLALADAIIGK